MNNPGFVYFLTNPSMPGILKIGCSSKPLERCKQLSSATCLPTPFKMELYQFVLDMQRVEQTIHRMFDHFRVNDNREFFRMSPGLAIETFSDWAMAVRLIPIIGEDYETGEYGLIVLHDGSTPIHGLSNKDKAPVIRWIFEQHYDLIKPLPVDERVKS